MLSANIINRLSVFVISVFVFSFAQAQENSPYSRYGIGNLTNTKHINQQAQGGVDVISNDNFSINFNNPASYARLFRVTYDIGVGYQNTILKSNSLAEKYKTNNVTPNYLSVAFPLNKKRKIGGAFGFKPYSRVGYDITQATRVPGIDSLYQYYIGSGGLNQVYAGLGKAWGNDTSTHRLNIGFNTGYLFGKKQIETRKEFLADSSYIVYQRSNSQTRTNFGNVFFQLGGQYEVKIGESQSKMSDGKGVHKSTYLAIGFNAQFAQSFTAKQDTLRETYYYDASGAAITFDSVYFKENAKINVKLPATYTVGIALKGKELNGTLDKWMIGAQYQTAKFSDYRFNGQTDATADMWNFSVGGSFVPKPGDIKMFKRATYRAGFNMGKDYISVNGEELKTVAGTFGVTFPVRKFSNWTDQFTFINTALEIGKRGNDNTNLSESYVKFSVGLSLTDIWFKKRKYD